MLYIGIICELPTHNNNPSSKCTYTSLKKKTVAIIYARTHKTRTYIYYINQKNTRNLYIDIYNKQMCLKVSN